MSAHPHDLQRWKTPLPAINERIGDFMMTTNLLILQPRPYWFRWVKHWINSVYDLRSELGVTVDGIIGVRIPWVENSWEFDDFGGGLGVGV